MRNARLAKRAEFARCNAKQRCWKVRNCHCSRFVRSFSLVCVSSTEEISGGRAKFSTRIARVRQNVTPRRLDPPSDFWTLRQSWQTCGEDSVGSSFSKISSGLGGPLEEIERKNEAEKTEDDDEPPPWKSACKRRGEAWFRHGLLSRGYLSLFFPWWTTEKTSRENYERKK